MDTQNQALAPASPRVRALSRRDVVRPLFRYRRFALRLFLALAALSVAAALAWPTRYVSEMKILVKRDRAEPMLTPDRDAPLTASREVSDNDIYSEVALLKSRDLLKDVARASGLVPKGAQADAVTLARAVGALDAHLDIAPIRRTALIDVAYQSDDPRQAAQVLEALSRLYLEKHLAVHSTPGAHDFFTQQAERLRKELEAAEARLADFGREHHVVAAESERDSTLQRLAEFQANLETLHAQIADADRRLAALRGELTTTPQRLTTLQRRQDNGELLRDLTAKVLDLEIKRTEMLRKFTPEYPPVVQLEQQLAQARATLAAAQQSPIKDESTDQNPTHQWLRNEVARVTAERQALQARVAATATTIREYQGRARLLDDQGTQQQDLQRAVKSVQENYLLYQRKAEETRIADALDQRRIANVTVVERPNVPTRPTTSRIVILLAGLAFAFAASVAATLLLHRADPRFRSRTEVEAVLELPVLAALPVRLTR